MAAHHNVGAAAPGQATPATNDEGPPVAAVAPQESKQDTAILPDAEALVHALARKRVATAKARAALLGIVVHELRADDGGPEWIATRWALTRAFRSVDELAAWLDRVEGTRSSAA